MAIIPKRSWKWCLAAALLAATILLAFHRHEPIARMPLADGTELRLEYVTYGTEHRVPGAGRLKAWLYGVAQRWVSPKIPRLEAEYTSTYPEPQLCLWFTLFDPKTQKYLPDVDEVLSVTCADYESGNFANEYTDHITASRYAERNTLPMPRALLRSVNYPRREKDLRLSVTRNGETAIFTIPNPAAQDPFPAWRPEPLPQTRRVGEFDVVLQSVELQRPVNPPPGTEYVKVWTRFQVLYQGRPLIGSGPFEFLPQDPQFFDATGNLGDVLRPPPYSEPAWKVRMRLVRTGDYPFAPTDGVLFAPTPLPGAETCQLLAVPEAERAKGFLLAALLGPGCYTFQDGALLLAEPAMQRSRFETSSRRENRPRTVMINVQAPTVAFVFAGDRRTAPGGALAVRVTCDGIGYALPEPTHGWLDTRTYHTFPGAEPPSIEIYNFTGPKKPLPAPVPDEKFPRLDPHPRGPTPLPGTPVTIQVVPTHPETIEYLIAPPK